MGFSRSLRRKRRKLLSTDVIALKTPAYVQPMLYDDRGALLIYLGPCIFPFNRNGSRSLW